MSNGKNVYVVDDNIEVRRSIFRLLEVLGMSPRSFAQGQDFLDALPELAPGCVLLDLRLPDVDGVEVLQASQAFLGKLQFVMITGHGDIETAVRVMRMGAIDFLEKPYSEDMLIETLERGFSTLAEKAAARDAEEGARMLLFRLTDRERDVLGGLLAGLSNKQLAQRLGLSFRTVEMHRAHMLSKLAANALSDALRIAIAGGLKPLAETGVLEPTGRLQ